MHKGRSRSASRTGKWGRAPRRNQITAEQFRDARVFGGLTRQDAADLLGVSLRTIGHWETGKSRPSYAAFKLLRVLRHGEFVDPAWQSYRVVRGKLVTPESHELVPADMGWLSLLFRRADAFSDLLRQRDRNQMNDGGALADGKADSRPRPHAPISIVLQSSGDAMSLKAKPDGLLETPITPLGGIGGEVTRIERRDGMQPHCSGNKPPQLAWEGFSVGASWWALPPCSNTGRTLEPRSGDPSPFDPVAMGVGS
ncbi:VC1465 family Xer recombination activation factor [Lysobacter aestuarii]|uniref:Helix-turn-helix domain-containing protein n=1 Tax=Marilutibacter aestuarii TaxID=1706195 RepID=A0A508AA85_9GAMM|nr:helix-turn-helix domain-containing protein [Lysobacter aestuarii]